MYGNNPKKKSYFITLIGSDLFFSSCFCQILINIQFVCRRENAVSLRPNPESFLRRVSDAFLVEKKYHSITH